MKSFEDMKPTTHIVLIIIIGILIYVLTGQYKSRTKYIGARIIYKLFFANILFSLAYFLLINSYYFQK